MIGRVKKLFYPFDQQLLGSRLLISLRWGDFALYDGQRKSVHPLCYVDQLRNVHEQKKNFSKNTVQIRKGMDKP